MNKYTKCGNYNLAYLISRGAKIEEVSQRLYSINGCALPDNAVMLEDIHIGTILVSKNNFGEQPVLGTAALNMLSV